MDDSLKQPGASPDSIESSDRLDADEENSSGDEDGGLNWTKLPASTAVFLVSVMDARLVGPSSTQWVAGGNEQLFVFICSPAHTSTGIKDSSADGNETGRGIDQPRARYFKFGT
ncbi:hypothetical protein PILCRDRAFT_3877 [Piloderma croceum F 1598]|uniref:Uncharacterized protein n=1 Tax=Piloderma croceum (strain F 1598) TaxID=765440 RepID=A0A0C3G6G2_PILCF|nr:hypothetical protein PILCRDRAFT_3877 [Piloderma croceum F 1598]